MTDASPSAFEPLNMVERQLVAAATGGPEQQKAFERFILDETLYVATPEVPAQEDVTVVQEGTSINILHVPLNDGRQATAVFTSPQRVGQTFGQVGYMGIQGRALFDMVGANPALLNPGQAYGVLWEPEAMAAMLGMSIPRTLQKDTQVMLGFPSDPPTDLIARLKTAFDAVPQVQAAWLALAVWPEEKTQSWYLDVRTSSPDHDPVRRALSAAIDGADLMGRPVDMVIHPVGGADGAGIVVMATRSPEPPKKGFFGRLLG